MTISFNIDDIVADYDAEDFEIKRAEPRDDVFFEFKVEEIELKEAPKGYLQLAAKVSALDSKANAMFSKFVNAALPVTYKGHSPHEAAAGIFRQFILALSPENLGYDKVTTDAATDKAVYWLNGSVLSKDARDAAFKGQAVTAKNVLDNLVKKGPDARNKQLEEFVGRTFYAKVETKNGYTNVTKITGLVPSGATVVYDSKEAFSK